jgi:hypothetical protein
LGAIITSAVPWAVQVAEHRDRDQAAADAEQAAGHAERGAEAEVENGVYKRENHGERVR